jgi:hypothetical protein
MLYKRWQQACRILHAVEVCKPLLHLNLNFRPGLFQKNFQFLDYKNKNMKNRIYLNFTINDFNDITHDEISHKLGIRAGRIMVKGEKRFPNSPGNPMVWTTNRWIMPLLLLEWFQKIVD